MSLLMQNVAPLSLNQLAFVFQLGIYIIIPGSVVPSATAANVICKSTDILRNSGLNTNDLN
jgi:hypothetical protein